ncbi:hypothetical protein [Lachnoclostridium sp.]|uniref:hypothetical protein n=1 Tax=Lachnoclostridium sp. TaxID=2028282 RepID=UPI00289AB449|nr:hypothetical protein [Lachnoclostridium sp.]
MKNDLSNLDFITLGRPSESMTDSEWQVKYKILKSYINPFQKKNGKLISYSKEIPIWEDETNGSCYGLTNWQSYCSFINDILSQIRRGRIEYCYYAYQIADILPFEYDTLKTHYNSNGRYWDIWIDKN